MSDDPFKPAPTPVTKHQNIQPPQDTLVILRRMLNEQDERLEMLIAQQARIETNIAELTISTDWRERFTMRVLLVVAGLLAGAVIARFF